MPPRPSMTINSRQVKFGGHNISNGSSTVGTCFDHAMRQTGFHHGKEPRRTASCAKTAKYQLYAFLRKTVTYWTHCTQVPSKIIDATRLSDGAYVTLKIIRPSVHPYEVEIGQYFSSESLRADPANHCVPVYEVIPIPEEQRVIIVMPLLRDYTSPPFYTFGEVVECFRQLFEVRTLDPFYDPF